MTKEDQSLIIGALDSLGVALADHDHEWTEGERCIYESAVECVQRVAMERCRLAAARGYLKLRAGEIYAGKWPAGTIQKRLITKIEGGLVEWQPVEYEARGPWRCMKASSFRAWVLGAASDNGGSEPRRGSNRQ